MSSYNSFMVPSPVMKQMVTLILNSHNVLPIMSKVKLLRVKEGAMFLFFTM